jgi:hypothetical protein
MCVSGTNVCSKHTTAAVAVAVGRVGRVGKVAEVMLPAEEEAGAVAVVGDGVAVATAAVVATVAAP